MEHTTMDSVSTSRQWSSANTTYSTSVPAVCSDRHRTSIMPHPPWLRVHLSAPCCAWATIRSFDTVRTERVSRAGMLPGPHSPCFVFTTWDLQEVGKYLITDRSIGWSVAVDLDPSLAGALTPLPRLAARSPSFTWPSTRAIADRSRARSSRTSVITTATRVGL
jgi:hypothetical protein